MSCSRLAYESPKTFDGSPESFARAPLNMMKLDEVYKSLVENPSNHGMNDDHLNVMKQLILEKQEEIRKTSSRRPANEEYTQTRSVR